jgi:hypothetical protein
MRQTYLESLTMLPFHELGQKDVNPCQAQVAQASDRPTQTDPHLQTCFRFISDVNCFEILRY